MSVVIPFETKFPLGSQLRAIPNDDETVATTSSSETVTRSNVSTMANPNRTTPLYHSIEHFVGETQPMFLAILLGGNEGAIVLIVRLAVQDVETIDDEEIVRRFREAAATGVARIPPNSVQTNQQEPLLAQSDPTNGASTPRRRGHGSGKIEIGKGAGPTSTPSGDGDANGAKRKSSQDIQHVEGGMAARDAAAATAYKHQGGEVAHASQVAVPLPNGVQANQQEPLAHADHAVVAVNEEQEGSSASSMSMSLFGCSAGSMSISDSLFSGGEAETAESSENRHNVQVERGLALPEGETSHPSVAAARPPDNQGSSEAGDGSITSGHTKQSADSQQGSQPSVFSLNPLQVFESQPTTGTPTLIPDESKPPAAKK